MCEKNQVCSGTLFKKRQEARNETIYKIHELVKRWDKRITFDNLRLIDRFRNFELSVFLHFRIDHSDKLWVVGYEPEPAKESIPSEKIILGEGQHHAVLVDVIQLMESKKGIPFPALVRLGCIDCFYRFWPNSSLYCSSRNGFVYVDGLSDGKRNVVGIACRGVQESQLVGQMVKRTPEILDDISCGCKSVEGHNSELSDIWTTLRSVTVSIHAEKLEVLFRDKLSHLIQIQEMLFGPFNLYPDEHKPRYSR